MYFINKAASFPSMFPRNEFVMLISILMTSVWRFVANAGQQRCRDRVLTQIARLYPRHLTKSKRVLKLTGEQLSQVVPSYSINKSERQRVFFSRPGTFHGWRTHNAFLASKIRGDLDRFLGQLDVSITGYSQTVNVCLGGQMITILMVVKK